MTCVTSGLLRMVITTLSDGSEEIVMVELIIPAHEVVNWRCLVEDEGWRHEILFDIGGNKLCIADDTDHISAYSSEPGIDVKIVGALWLHYKMGTSTFDSKMPQSLRVNDYKGLMEFTHNKIFSGPGSKLGFIVHNKVEEYPRYSIQVEFTDEDNKEDDFSFCIEGPNRADVIEKAIIAIQENRGE